LTGVPLGKEKSRYKKLINGILNILITKTFYFILSFPLAFLGLIVYIASFFKIGLPIFHITERTGINQTPIKFYKFRTLDLEDKQKFKDPLSKENFVNNFASFLRKTKLDEIPQVISLINGDMKIFGYRPLLHCQIDFIPLEIRRKRASKKPGLVGKSIISSDEQMVRLGYDTTHVSIINNIKTFFKIIYNFNKLETNKTTLKWDDFYLINKPELFEENYSIIIEKDIVNLYSIEQKMTVHNEKLNLAVESNINNSIDTYFKTIVYLLIFDLKTNTAVLQERFKYRTFYYDKKKQNLYYLTPDAQLYLAHKFETNIKSNLLFDEISKLIDEKTISIYLPLKIHKTN
jgi:lipopolysaccharide/colanic/teichoic acid biosynthesis glycosyltransferase